MDLKYPILKMCEGINSYIWVWGTQVTWCIVLCVIIHERHIWYILVLICINKTIMCYNLSGIIKSCGSVLSTLKRSLCVQWKIVDHVSCRIIKLMKNLREDPDMHILLDSKNLINKFSTQKLSKLRWKLWTDAKFY